MMARKLITAILGLLILAFAVNVRAATYTIPKDSTGVSTSTPISRGKTVLFHLRFKMSNLDTLIWGPFHLDIFESFLFGIRADSSTATTGTDSISITCEPQQSFYRDSLFALPKPASNLFSNFSDSTFEVSWYNYYPAAAPHGRFFITTPAAHEQDSLWYDFYFSTSQRPRYGSLISGSAGAGPDSSWQKFYAGTGPTEPITAGSLGVTLYTADDTQDTVAVIYDIEGVTHGVGMKVSQRIRDKLILENKINLHGSLRFLDDTGGSGGGGSVDTAGFFGLGPPEIITIAANDSIAPSKWWIEVHPASGNLDTLARIVRGGGDPFKYSGKNDWLLLTADLGDTIILLGGQGAGDDSLLLGAPSRRLDHPADYVLGTWLEPTGAADTTMWVELFFANNGGNQDVTIPNDFFVVRSASNDTTSIVMTADSSIISSTNDMRFGAGSVLISTDGTVTIGKVGAYSTGNFGADEYDFRVGSNDSASVMRIGNLEFGTSDDRTIAPSFTAGGATYFATVGAPDGIAEFVFTTSDGDMRLVLPIAGAGYGTYNPRSMIIAGPSVFKDSIMIGTYWGFNRLNMNTDSLGADLGVQNSVQVGDSLFVNSAIIIGGEQFTSQSDSTMIKPDIITMTGPLSMKEITTPSADANYGKIYTKTDDNLYFQDGAGTEHTLLKGSASTQHQFFLPLEAPTGTVGNWDVVTINAAQSVHFACQIPEDFETLAAATIVMIPDATETVQWDILVSVAAAGEAYNHDDRTTSDETLAVTVNQITEADISGSLTGLTAGDYIAIDFQSDTANLRIVGFEFDYN